VCGVEINKEKDDRFKPKFGEIKSLTGWNLKPSNLTP
jgi:hypothetical protein